MALSESRKKANAKWDKENMTTLGCKIRREHAAAFKSYCTNRGQTSNTALKDYVLGCIGGQESPQEAAGDPQETVAGILLTPSTLKTAQEAAEAAGEALPEFVTRAVSETAERDRLSRDC